ncbi:MAG: hypothetical protein ABH873_01690 [Candidatus Firestonebacteria bacterium]
MKNNKNYLKIIIYFFYVFAIPCFVLCETDKNQLAFIVCTDKKIYVIDTNSEKLIKTAGPFEELGHPSSIDIDSKNGILYISNEHARRQISQYGIIGISIEKMEVIKRIKLDSDTPEHGSPEVYQIRYSPEGIIYAGYYNPKHNKLTTAINPDSGEIMFASDIPIDQESIFSSDGKKMVAIWPGGKRGDKTWVPGVALYEDMQDESKKKVQEGDKIFTDGNGLNPPWEKLKLPLLVIEAGVMKSINRLTGKMIYEINLESLNSFRFNNYMIYIPLCAVTSDGNKALITFNCNDKKSYCAIINLKDREINTMIEIGAGPTNVVLDK